MRQAVEGAGHREDPPGLEREPPQLPRPGQGDRRWRRARITVHGRTREARYRIAGRLGRDRRSRRGRPRPRRGQRRPAVPARGCRNTCDLRLRGRDERARRADQTVALPRGRDRRLLGHHGRGTRAALPALRRPRDRALGSTPGRAGRRPRRSLDDHGRERVRDFLRWHVGFWVRYAPRRARRFLADDAAARVRVRAAVAARGAARAARRRGGGLHHRTTDRRRRSRATRRRSGTDGDRTGRVDGRMPGCCVALLVRARCRLRRTHRRDAGARPVFADRW